MADIEMTRTQYENLLAAAKSGDENSIKQVQAEIDAANEIIRYELRVRWTDLGGKEVPVPIPQTWPPEQEGILIKESTIGKEDVEEFVNSRTDGQAMNIHVTADLDGNAGWHLLDDYDFQSNAS